VAWLPSATPGCRLVARALPELDVLGNELARGNSDDILGAVEGVQHEHVRVGRGTAASWPSRTG
jgi:hypothetical protein